MNAQARSTWIFKVFITFGMTLWLIAGLTGIALAMPLGPGNEPRLPARTTATITVQSAADDGTTNPANCPGAGCRLRDALAYALPNDTITFDGSYTITLVSTLTISKNVTIDGAGYAVTVSGNHAVRVFTVNADVTFNLLNLTVAQGYTSGNGGGIYNSGTLTITNSTLSGNSATDGGGIFNTGTLAVMNNTLSGNSAIDIGGSISNSGGTLTMSNSTLSGNSATYAGGIFNNDALILTMTNSTLSGNSAVIGGGIYNRGALTVMNITLSGNSAVAGGGIYNFSGILMAKNSLLANSAGDNCDGNGTIDGSNNLADDDTCSAGFTNSATILLGALGNYGGGTLTVPLLPGSAAIDAGDSATCAAAPVSNLDQRGVARPSACDIGAYESRGFTLIKSGGDNQSAIINTAFTTPLALNVTSAYAEPVDGGTITFAGTLPGAGTNPITSTAIIAGGVVAQSVTANSAGGSYAVTASASGVSPNLTYNLTNTYVITPTADANGSIEPNAPQAVNYGDSVPFTIAAATGYHISDVVVDGLSHGPIDFYIFNNVTANHTINAEFAINAYFITSAAGAHGSITPSMPQTVNYGDSITFTITPDMGFAIVDVFVDGVSQGAISSYTFSNTTANHTISASFANHLFIITPSAGPGGSLSPNSPQAVNAGDSITFTIAANTGFAIDDVVVDGVSQGAISRYTFSNVTADHAITAAFSSTGPQTQMVGVMSVRADNFTDLGGGLTQADGHIRLGQYLFLTGPGDNVIYDATTLTATGKLTLQASGSSVDVLMGTFRAPTATGVAVPLGPRTDLITSAAGFLVGDVSISAINIPIDQLSVNANLFVQTNDITATTGVDFYVTGASGGLVYSGTLTEFDFTLSGLTVTVDSGATLSDVGIAIPTATLTLPASMGGTSVTINDLSLTSSSLSIGDNLHLPDIKYGDGSKLKITNPSAQLALVNNQYQFSANGTLSITLPNNAINSNLAFTITQGGQLTGTVDLLNLTVAGSTLTLTNIAITNSGLSVDSALLQMSAGLGGTVVTIGGLTIDKTGLSINEGSLLLPDIKYGDGSKLKIANPGAQLALVNNQYQFSANGTLSITLPGNSINSNLAFTITQGGQLTGTVDLLNLTVAGSTLTLTNIAMTNHGLAVDSALLQMPNSLGGAVVTVNAVTIDQTGLSVSAGSFTVADIKIGDGSKVKIVAPTATLSNTASGYTFGVSGTLQLRLPDNSQDIALAGSVNTHGQFTATISSINLTLAKATLRLNNITMDNTGLAVASGTLALPAKLGGVSGQVANVRIDAHGLSIGGGEVNFPIPNFKIGGTSGFGVSDALASLTLMNNGGSTSYRMTLSGTIAITLPGTSASASGAIEVDNAGNIGGSVDAFTLAVAGLNLSVSSVTINADGSFAIGSATLALPGGFGGGSANVTNVVVHPGQPGSLSLGGAGIMLPDIKWGDGSKVRITNASAQLTQVNNKYSFAFGGLLSLNLPGNSVNSTLAFSIKDNGQISGTVDLIKLTVAGGALTMTQVGVSNSGLTVGAAALKMPASLGNAVVTINGVSIDSTGLHLGGGNLTLADINIGDGSKVKIVGPSATLGTVPGGYTFGINGTLQLRLPSNSQNIAIAGSINSAGQFSATVSALALTFGGATLNLNNIGVNNTGLSVVSGTLNLPAKLGGASGSVNNVVINAHGLSIGGGAVTFPIPNFKIGGSSGFSVSNAQAGLELTNSGHSYSLNLSGTVAIKIPSSNASASGSVRLDDAGNFSGQVDAFALSVAGLGLNVSNVVINADGSLSAGSASFTTPSGFGGAAAAVYNVVIRPGNPGSLSIGGGDFTLPAIKAGGFALALSGSLTPISGGYEISTKGYATFPGVGGATGCKGIGVGATIWTNGLGQTQLTLRPAETDSLVLKNASFNFQCQIAIGTTGFFITGLSGSVTLSSASTQVNVAIQIAAGKKLAGLTVLSADADATIKTNPFDFVLNGAVRVFVFQVGGATAHLTDHSFSATLWVDIIVANGNISINAWSDNGFHISGSGNMSIGFRKGSVWKSPSFPIYYLECHGFWPSCQWKKKSIDGISIPPFDFNLANAGVEFGEFSGDRWGVKAKVSLFGFSTGIYIDNQGTLSIGNVDNYTLVEPARVNQAIEKYQAAQRNGLTQLDKVWEVDGIQFVDNSIIIPQTLTTTTDVIFALARNQAVPTLTLITPAGIDITPDTLPGNVDYQTVMTYTPIVTSSGVTSATIELAYQSGTVRFTHARPDLGAVDVKIDGSVLFNNVAFGAESADRVLISGTHTLELVPAGNVGPILYSTVISITGNSTQRLISAGGVTQTVLLNATESPTATTAGQATVRFVQGALDAPALDVVLADNGQMLFAAASPLSIVDAVELDAGQHSFALYATGTYTPLTQITTTLVANAKYTLIALGNATGIPALQLVLHADELPLAQVRLVNALIGNEPINLLTHSIAVFQSIPYTAATPYYSFSSTTLDVQLQLASAAATVLYNGSHALHVEADHTLIAMGYVTQTQAVLLVDDNSLPTWGMTRVRVVNAAPNSSPVDVTVQGGSLWFTNTAYLNASNYLSVAVESGTPLTLEVRDHATTNLLLTVPNLKFVDGNVYTLFLTGLEGGSPALQLVQYIDVATRQDIQSQYTVHQAQTGTWGMKLNGNLAPTDQYLLTMLGSNPAPALTDLSVAISGTTAMTASWRLASDELPTQISIYANPGPITTTNVITDSFNVTSTVVNDRYDGISLAQNLTSTQFSWIDGSLQTRMFNSNLLPSGTYHVWFEADDGRNPPVRQYAPKLISVNHAAAWPLTWTATFTVTPAFRSLAVEWLAHSHADVDGYRLLVAAPGLTSTLVITTGNVLAAAVDALEPGRPYSLTLEAYDTESGRASRSQTVMGVPAGAPITLSGPTSAVNLIAGQSQTIALTVSTTQQPYPGAVSWQVGCVRLNGTACTSNVNGLNALFTDEFITPTLAGVVEPIVIAATEALPAGNYVVPIIATGSGVSRTLDVIVAVQIPSFTLDATSSTPVLGIDQVLNVTVSSAGLNGATRPIGLSVKNAPLGLLWSLDDDSIEPGNSATLTITDTTLLASGVYPIGISGDDGLLTTTTTITLTVSKPRFNLTAIPATLNVAAGKPMTAVFALNLIALDGWTTPITLTVNPSDVPALGTLGLRGNATAGEVSSTLVVTPGGVGYLVAVTTANTPQFLYTLNIDAQGGGRQQMLAVALAVREFKVYLPLIRRSAVVASLTRHQ